MPLIVVGGALANRAHNGGGAWVRLSYLLGLRRLGCEVFFIEEIGAEQVTPESVAFFTEVVSEFGLLERSALVVRSDGETVLGPALGELVALAGEADLLINLSGNLASDHLFSHFARRAYVDLDPGYTQLWLDQGHSVGRAREHHLWFTVGLNVGTPASSLPDAGLGWRPMLPPVLLEEWPFVPSPGPDPLTTVAAWRGAYGRLEADGVLYTQKAHEFRKLLDLPRQVPAAFEVALHIDEADEADRRLLEEHAWHVVDPYEVVATPAAFRRYVQGSGAELSPAQGVYVETRSGWFSDRTAHYLASGRPAIVQDTGFGESFPLERCLLTFRAPDDAVGAIEELRSNYEAYSRAARSFAERHLDSDRVLARVLEEAGLGG